MSGLPPVERGQKCSVTHVGRRETSSVCSSSLLPRLLAWLLIQRLRGCQSHKWEDPKSPIDTRPNWVTPLRLFTRVTGSLPLCWALTWTKKTDPKKHKIPWCSTASLSTSPGLGDTAKAKRVPLCASGNCRVSKPFQSKSVHYWSARVSGQKTGEDGVRSGGRGWSLSQVRASESPLLQVRPAQAPILHSSRSLHEHLL